MLTDYEIVVKLEIALFLLLITAVVFLGLGILIGGLLFGRRKASRDVSDVLH